MGLHVLKHAAVSSRTSSLRMERMETLIAEWRSRGQEQDPKTRRFDGDLQPSDGGPSSGAGKLAAVGDNEKEFCPR